MTTKLSKERLKAIRKEIVLREDRKCYNKYCNNIFTVKINSKRKFCSFKCINKGRRKIKII